mgnify:CR=1 FL=1
MTTPRKSIRLNKSLRTEIVNNIMSSYDAANPEPVRPEPKGGSIDDMVKAYFLNKHKKIIDEVSKLNTEILDLIYLMGPSDSIQYQDEKGYWNRFFLSEEDLIKYKIPYNLRKNAVINLSDPDQLTAPLRKALEAKKKFEKTTLKEYKQKYKDYDLERRNYIQQIQTVLGGVNTSNQLLEVWPEVEEYLPVGVVEPSKIQLPSVNIQTLNSALIK